MDPPKSPSGAASSASPQEKVSRPTWAQNERNAKMFHERLTSWREWVVDLQRRLCRDLVAIAFANRGCLGANPLDWVNECIDNYWVAHRPGFKNWAVLCCDWADPDGWTAPGWLLSEVPEEILKHHIQTAPLAETLDGRVFAPYTEVIRERIASLIEMRLHMARIGVLDDAKIKIASEPAAKRVKPSASSVERVNEAVYAIGRRYGNEWDRKWLESTRGLYAELHATQVEHAVGESSPREPEGIGIVEPKAKRGPKANMKFHHEVAEVVNSFGFGANWKELSNLEKIAKKIDRRKIPALRAWAKRERVARTWRRAVEFYADVVRKALEYSLEMAAKDIPEKPSKTLGNLR